MAFPTAEEFGDDENEYPQQEQIFQDWLAGTKQLFGAADETAITIASGSITIASSLVNVDTESSLSTDDLDYILTAEGSELRVVVLRATDPGRVVTLRHGQGGIRQILLQGAADVVLDATTKSIMLVLRGTDWVEVARSWVAASIPEAKAGTATDKLMTPAGVESTAGRGFHANKNDVNQGTIPAATTTKITFNNEVEDTDGWYDNTNSKFQPTMPGVFLVVAAVAWNGIQDNDNLRTYIYKNGSIIHQSAMAAGGTFAQNVIATAFVRMNGSTDYIEIYAQKTANSGSVDGFTFSTWFQAYKV